MNANFIPLLNLFFTVIFKCSIFIHGIVKKCWEIAVSTLPTNKIGLSFLGSKYIFCHSLSSIKQASNFSNNFAVSYYHKIVPKLLLLFWKFFFRHCSVTMAAERRWQRRQNSRSFFHSQSHQLNGIQALSSHRNAGQIR
jgi:hypothetical protein